MDPLIETQTQWLINSVTYSVVQCNVNRELWVVEVLLLLELKFKLQGMSLITQTAGNLEKQFLIF